MNRNRGIELQAGPCAGSTDPLAELTGFFLAHAVWCVVDGETLIPMLASEDADARWLARYDGEDLTHCVSEAQAVLEAGSLGTLRAVLVFDGYFTGDDAVRRDALVAHAIEYGLPRRTHDVVLPYRRPDATGGFAVHRPKILDGVNEEDSVAFGEALFRGAHAHADGGRIWAERLDESA